MSPFPVDPREHWAFKSIEKTAAAPRITSSWIRNPIDAFIAAEHRRAGLSPASEASRAVLLRRLCFDLTGLPPTSHQIDATLHDPSSRWYQRTLDRLLDDPAHGERWARHWMDVLAVQRLEQL